MATEIDIAVTTTTYNVSITATPNEYIVNITTGGSGGVQTVTGTTADNTDPLNPVVGVPSLQEVTDVGASTTNPVVSEANVQGLEVIATDALNTITLRSGDLAIVFDNGTNNGVLNTDGLDANYGWTLPNQSGTLALTSDIPPSAVDSVNGQTGVVVLDATDVGAEPTKGVDDNYVTDAQLVVIGNTSGTNSGDNATNTKYDVTATTGAVISFATPQIYNSIASPSSSNITDNLTGARIGVVQKIYHNAGTTPTFPAGWVRRGTGTYVTSTLNIIYAEWSVGTTVEYWITQ